MKRAESYKVRASLIKSKNKNHNIVFRGLIYYNDHTGKRISKTITLKSKQELDASCELVTYRNDFQRTLNITVSGNGKHSIFTEYAKYTEWERGRVKASTFSGYESRKQYVDRYFALPDTPDYVEDLHTKQVADYYEWLLKSGKKDGTPLSHHTVSDAKMLFNRFMKYEIMQGIISSNPVDHVMLTSPKNRQKKEIAFLSCLQCKKLLEFLSYGEYSDLYSIVLTAIYTGMRREELIGLRWKSVDLDKGLLIVERTVVKLNKGLDISEHTKTDAGHRTVVLCQPVVKELSKLWEGLERHQKSAEVFLNRNGKMWGPDNLSKRFKKALIECFGENIAKPLHFHSLRATTTTLLRDSGMSLEDIQKFIGHTIGNQVTVDHYYGTSQRQIQNLKTHLDNLFA